MSKFEKEVRALDFKRCLRVFRWQLALVPVSTMVYLFEVERGPTRVSMRFLEVYLFGFRVARIHRNIS